MKKLIFTLVIFALPAAFADTPQHSECATAEKALAQHLHALYASNPRLNNTQPADAQEITQQALIAHIRTLITQHPALARQCPFSEIQSEYAFSAPVSPDGALRAWSFDTHSGGSQHNYYTLMHYQNDAGQTILIEPEAPAPEDGDTGAMITAIYRAELPGKARSYWLHSHAAVMNGYHIRTMTLITTDHGKPTPAPWIRKGNDITDRIGVEYDAFAAADENKHAEFIYNDADKTLTAPVADCDENQVRACTLTDTQHIYRWDGAYFSLSP